MARFRRRGLAGRSTSLEAGFGSLELHTISSLLSLLCAVVHDVSSQHHELALSLLLLVMFSAMIDSYPFGTLSLLKLSLP